MPVLWLSLREKNLVPASVLKLWSLLWPIFSLHSWVKMINLALKNTQQPCLNQLGASLGILVLLGTTCYLNSAVIFTADSLDSPLFIDTTDILQRHLPLGSFVATDY